MLFLISEAFENNILIKLNRGNTVKLIIEVRLNLGQHFAFGLTLRNKRFVSKAYQSNHSPVPISYNTRLNRETHITL